VQRELQSVGDAVRNASHFHYPQLTARGPRGIDPGPFGNACPIARAKFCDDSRLNACPGKALPRDNSDIPHTIASSRSGESEDPASYVHN